MIRGLGSLLILSALLIGLGAYIYFIESERPTSEEAALAKDAVFEVEADAIESMTVTASSGERSVLRKQDDTWRLVEPVDAAVAEFEVTGLASALASLEIERVVDEAATEIGQFGLADPRIEVTFETADATEPRVLRLGDTTTTGGDVYARIDDERRVFLVAGFRETTFDKTPFDFRDKSILEFDREQLTSVEIQRPAGIVRASKRDDTWHLEEPWDVRADSSTVESLVSRLQTVQMKSIEVEDVEGGDDEVDLASYGLADPTTTVTLGTGSARATLAIGDASESGDLYAHDLARSMVFTVEVQLIDDLTKDAVDYRRKDIFDFRSWNATRLELTRDGATMVFEKVPATDDEAETWRQVEPAAGDADDEAVRAVLSALSGLRAESFAESREGTGLDAPVLTVDVRFDDGDRQERVAFGRVDDGVHASTDAEDSPARLDATAFDEALEAVDALGATP